MMIGISRGNLQDMSHLHHLQLSGKRSLDIQRAALGIEIETVSTGRECLIDLIE